MLHPVTPAIDPILGGFCDARTRSTTVIDDDDNDDDNDRQGNAMSGPPPSGGPPPMASDDIILRNTPGYRGDTQLYLNGFLIGFSTLFVGARLYARCFMVKRPGIDDVIAVLCLGCLIALSTMEIRLVQVGSGTHIIYVSENKLFAFFDALTTQSLLYFWSVCLMRLHIAAFLPNLHQESE